MPRCPPTSSPVQIGTAPQHLFRQRRAAADIQHSVLHAAQPPVHLEDAGRDIAPDPVLAARAHHRQHKAEQVLEAFHGEAVRKHLFARRARQRKAFDLVEAVLLHPADTPPVLVPLALGLVHHTLHGVVVVHPRLPDIVAHGFRHAGRGDFQHGGQLCGGLRVKPHEDGHSIYRPLLECAVHPFARGHHIEYGARMRPLLLRLG
jgi:hypothetical protein